MACCYRWWFCGVGGGVEVGGVEDGAEGGAGAAKTHGAVRGVHRRVENQKGACGTMNTVVKENWGVLDEIS